MEDTFPKLLFRNCQQWGSSRVALRKKEYGVWREHTWEDCYHKVKAIFGGLASLGLEAGSGVSILADSNPEWFWCELAVLAARGIVTGLNPAGSAEDTKGLMLLAQPKFVLAQDQEQVDKLLEVKDGAPSLQRVVYWNEKGLRHYNNPILISLAEVIKLGEERERNHPGEFERKMAHGRGDDLAMIIFALGANDSLKVVPATHGFLISSLENVLASNPVYDTDDYVSVITPGWLFEQTLGFTACLVKGQKLNFAERVETAPEDSREISPNVLVYPPRVWADIASAIQTNVADGTRLKRRLFNWSLSIGQEVAEESMGNDRVGLPKRFRHAIAEALVFRPLRDKHGFNRARLVYAAGKRASPETVRFFRAIGIDLQQVFGSTQGGVVTVAPEEKLMLE